MSKNKVKILFIGEVISSHAQSWISLLDDQAENFDILTFGVPGSPYPQDSKYKMFLGTKKIISNQKLSPIIQKILLDYVIRTYKPNIIHTFAAFPTCSIYHSVISKHKDKVKWVAQVRGGPDVYINYNDPIKKELLIKLFKDCDVLIADNNINYDVAKKLGILPLKCWGGGIAPGTGGVNIADFKAAKKPSESEYRIVWTKAYEGFESKALPVLEGIKLAWPKIKHKNVKFTFCAINQELLDMAQLLPFEIRNNIDFKERIPRDEILNIMMNSRVVMAPSLLEGIPNSLYESMASKCVPIYSPLDTYFDKFSDRKNILYARNLYSDEIAEAINTAINDDVLADQIAEKNFNLVQKIANKEKISKEIADLYKYLAKAKL